VPVLDGDSHSKPGGAPFQAPGTSAPARWPSPWAAQRWEKQAQGLKGQQRQAGFRGRPAIRLKALHPLARLAWTRLSMAQADQ